MARSRFGSADDRKPKDGKKVIKRLWKYIYNYKWLLFFAILLSIGGNLLMLWGPKLSGNAIDAIGTDPGGVDFQKVLYYVVLMIIFYAASGISTYALSRVMIKISQNTIFHMRKDVFEKLTTLPVSFFDRHRAGDIVSRISYDIDTVNASLSHDIVQITTSFITVVGSFVMMLAISPSLLSVFIISIPVALLFTRYMVNKVRPLFRLRSRKLGELNGFVEEIISGQKTIKAYRRERYFIERFDDKNIDAVDAYYNADYYSSVVGPGINFVNNLSLALISILGSILYILGGITLGNLSSFVLYSRRFSGPINELANIISELQSAAAAAERIFALLDEEPEKPDDEDAHVLSDVRGDIEAENVKFGYDPDKVIIKNFSISAKRGQLVAIVGHTGAGKTTIINLLMRFYDPQSGTIKIDGFESRKVTRDSLRRSFSMVLQDTWLFRGTIYENIAYGKEGATLEEVRQACRAAKIDSYIESLSDGYDTVIDNSGMNISQGQKQLLTIARAMLLDSAVLILDEATSNVDTYTEMLIQEAMRSLMKDKTCFVIAHRLSTIQHADTILVMQDGDVVEQGTHGELLQKNGVYAELYNSQFK